MAIAILRASIPGTLQAMNAVLAAAIEDIGATPANPMNNRIVAWTYEGTEVELKDWSLNTLLRENVQGLTFWMDNGQDFFVSWRQDGELHELSFSEAAGDYMSLQKIFGSLMRKMAPLYRLSFSHAPMLSVGFE